MALDEFFHKLNLKFPELKENIRQALVDSNSTSEATSICLSQLRGKSYKMSTSYWTKSF